MVATVGREQERARLCLHRAFILAGKVVEFSKQVQKNCNEKRTLEAQIGDGVSTNFVNVTLESFGPQGLYTLKKCLLFLFP